MDNDKPKRKNKPGAGRPTKMDIWVTKLEEVLSENTLMFLTDEDLVTLVNEKIDDETFHITSRTLRNWKTGKTGKSHTEDIVGKKFIKLINKALIEQKQALLTKMLAGDDKYWYRYGFVLERRFSEWNLKSISEVKNTNEQKSIIQITAANDEQRALIDNIINVDFVEVKPLQLISPDDNKSEEYDF